MTVPDSLALMWQDAQPCGSAPNKSNSVPDAVNRLWGYDLDQQQPCAYKQADGSPISYPDYIAVSDWHQCHPYRLADISQGSWNMSVAF
jgi:hypothetical protein